MSNTEGCVLAGQCSLASAVGWVLLTSIVGQCKFKHVDGGNDTRARGPEVVELWWWWCGRWFSLFFAVGRAVAVVLVWAVAGVGDVCIVPQSS